MESTNTLCINCEKTTQGLFCHHCGQKQGINRLTWGNLFSDLQKRLFGFDNNFLRTVKDLTIRPQVVVQSSIDGIRVRYIGAVGYYFLVVTIYIIIMSMFNIDMLEVTNQFNQSINPDASAEDLAQAQAFTNLIADNFRLVSFLMMPFFIFGIWIVFMNKGYNFLETSVLTFYGHAHPIWLAIIFLIFQKYSTNNFLFSLATVAPFLYTIILATIFYEGNKIWNFFKATLSLTIGLLLFAFATVIAGIIMAVINQ